MTTHPNAHIRYIAYGVAFIVAWLFCASLEVDDSNGWSSHALGPVLGALLALGVVLALAIAVEILRTMWEGWKIMGHGWKVIIACALVFPVTMSFAACWLFVKGAHERLRLRKQVKRVNATLNHPQPLHRSGPTAKPHYRNPREAGVRPKLPPATRA